MIGKLKGRLTEVDENNLGLIETSSGVFYQVFLTSTFIKNHSLSKDVEIYTYLQVREDALVLFGFEKKDEYDFFKLLLTVSGVGPKTAFLVISFIPVDQLIKAVQSNDSDVFSHIPGLGKKTAMKIILELSSKLKTEFDMKKMILNEEDKTVLDALVSLGFKMSEAKKIFVKLPKDLSVEEKIKKALSYVKK